MATEKYVKIKLDDEGTYIHPFSGLHDAMRNIFGDTPNLDVGQTLTIEVIESDPEVMALLPEFDGF